MPTRGDLRLPRAYLIEGEWPDGELADDAPVAARYALVISRRLREAIPDRAQSRVAAQTGLARSTLHDLITGRGYPDVPTLARLEEHLGCRLWPAEDDLEPH